MDNWLAVPRQLLFLACAFSPWFSAPCSGQEPGRSYSPFQRDSTHVEVSRPGPLVVRVLGRDGLPAKDAEVHWGEADALQLWCGSTDGSGRLQLSDQFAPPITLRAVRRPRLNQRTLPSGRVRPDAVPPGKLGASDYVRVDDLSADSSEIILSLGGVDLEGRVVDPSGSPVARLQLIVELAAREAGLEESIGLTSSSGWTDAQGSFRFHGLRPGTYRVYSRERTSGIERPLFDGVIRTGQADTSVTFDRAGAAFVRLKVESPGGVDLNAIYEHAPISPVVAWKKSEHAEAIDPRPYTKLSYDPRTGILRSGRMPLTPRSERRAGREAGRAEGWLLVEVQPDVPIVATATHLARGTAVRTIVVPSGQTKDVVLVLPDLVEPARLSYFSERSRGVSPGDNGSTSRHWVNVREVESGVLLYHAYWRPELGPLTLPPGMYDLTLSTSYGWCTSGEDWLPPSAHSVLVDLEPGELWEQSFAFGFPVAATVELATSVKEALVDWAPVLASDELSPLLGFSDHAARLVATPLAGGAPTILATGPDRVDSHPATFRLAPVSARSRVSLHPGRYRIDAIFESRRTVSGELSVTSGGENTLVLQVD